MATASLDEATAKKVLHEVEIYVRIMVTASRENKTRTRTVSENKMFSLAKICSLNWMKTILGLEEAKPKDVPQNVVKAVAEVLRKSPSLKISENGKNVGLAKLVEPNGRLRFAVHTLCTKSLCTEKLSPYLGVPPKEYPLVQSNTCVGIPLSLMACLPSRLVHASSPPPSTASPGVGLASNRPFTSTPLPSHAPASDRETPIASTGLNIPSVNISLLGFPGWSFWDGSVERLIPLPSEVVGVPTTYEFIPAQRYNDLMRMVAGLKSLVADDTRWIAELTQEADQYKLKIEKYKKMICAVKVIHKKMANVIKQKRKISIKEEELVQSLAALESGEEW